MKKIWLILATLAFSLTPTIATAQQSSLLEGQKHLYTVQLRSDKKALVYARIVFTNASPDTEQKTYTFSLPDHVSVNSLTAQQILAKNGTTEALVCKTYETLDQWRYRIGRSSSAEYDTSKQCLEQKLDKRHTIYNDDFDYESNISDSYYSYGYYQQRDSKFEYSDMNVSKSGTSYTLNLDRPVQPKKQGSVLLSFTTDDYISGGLAGRYDYNVRTLLPKQMISKATVAINFDENMYSRQAKQERGYSDQPTDDLRMSAGASAGQNASYESDSLDKLSSSIGQGGLYVKSQSSLILGDTLDVTGVFATNKLALFAKELFIGAIALLIVALGGFFGLKQFRRWRKDHPKATKSEMKDADSESTTSEDTSAVNQNAYSAPIILSQRRKWEVILLTTTLSSVATPILAVAYTFIANFLITPSGELYPYLAILLLIVTILMGLFVLPMLYILRYGVRVAFTWALLHIFVVLFITFTLLAAISMLESGTPYPRTDPYY